MEDAEGRRLSMARRVSSLLRENPVFCKSLAVKATDGSKPIIVALLDDKVGDILERITSTYPHGANVVLGFEGSRKLLTMVIRAEAPVVPFGDEPYDCPVHMDAEMGMFVAYLLAAGAPVRFMMVGSDYAAELEPVAA